MEQLASSQQITCSPEQAAQRLGISRTAIYALIKDRSIRSFKHGKSRLVVVASLHEWVADMQSYDFQDGE